MGATASPPAPCGNRTLVVPVRFCAVTSAREKASCNYDIPGQLQIGDGGRPFCNHSMPLASAPNQFPLRNGAARLVASKTCQRDNRPLSDHYPITVFSAAQFGQLPPDCQACRSEKPSLRIELRSAHPVQRHSRMVRYRGNRSRSRPAI